MYAVPRLGWRPFLFQEHNIYTIMAQGGVKSGIAFVLELSRGVLA